MICLIFLGLIIVLPLLLSDYWQWKCVKDTARDCIADKKLMTQEEASFFDQVLKERYGHSDFYFRVMKKIQYLEANNKQ